MLDSIHDSSSLQLSQQLLEILAAAKRVEVGVLGHVRRVLVAGFDGLAAKAQQIIGADPFSGHVFIFRSKRGHYLKGLYWDGSGLCLFAKRLERNKFVWPPIVDGTLTLTPAQLALLIEAMDWRRTIAPPAPPRPMLV